MISLSVYDSWLIICLCQAEDGIRYLVRSRGLGDVYKRQGPWRDLLGQCRDVSDQPGAGRNRGPDRRDHRVMACLLYTSDAADERSSVDLGGRRIIKKKKHTKAHTSNVNHSLRHATRSLRRK